MESEKKRLTLSDLPLYNVQCDTIHKLTTTFQFFDDLSRKHPSLMAPQAIASRYKVDEVLRQLERLHKEYKDLQGALTP